MSDVLLDSLGRNFPNPTDCSDDEFSSWIKEASMGDALGVHNLLCQCFNQMQGAKNELVELCKSEGTTKDRKETLISMYSMLHRIEMRIFECKKRVSILKGPEI